MVILLARALHKLCTMTAVSNMCDVILICVPSINKLFICDCFQNVVVRIEYYYSLREGRSFLVGREVRCSSNPIPTLRCQKNKSKNVSICPVQLLECPSDPLILPRLQERCRDHCDSSHAHRTADSVGGGRDWRGRYCAGGRAASDGSGATHGATWEGRGGSNGSNGTSTTDRGTRKGRCGSAGWERSLRLSVRDLGDDRSSRIGWGLGLPVGDLGDNRASWGLGLSVGDLGDNRANGAGWGLRLTIRDLGDNRTSRGLRLAVRDLSDDRSYRTSWGLRLSIRDLSHGRRSGSLRLSIRDLSDCSNAGSRCLAIRTLADSAG